MNTVLYYNATTLQSNIAKETDSTKQLGRIKHSTLSKFQQPIMELEYNQTPKKWRQVQMQATKKFPSKCEHQDRAKGLCRKMP
jgi:hypothetical protein